MVPAPPIENSLETPVSSAIEVPIVPARWSIRGNEPDAPFTFRYCCLGGGVAETTIALPRGTWLLGVTHASSECATSIHPVIVPANGDREVLVDAPAWAASFTLSKVSVSARNEDVPLRLQLYIEGGLHCCGTTTIEKVQIVPL
jgi:hypothetical protein